MDQWSARTYPTIVSSQNQAEELDSRRAVSVQSTMLTRIQLNQMRIVGALIF